jgi:hypothetical protein
MSSTIDDGSKYKNNFRMALGYMLIYISLCALRVSLKFYD